MASPRTQVVIGAASLFVVLAAAYGYMQMRGTDTVAPEKTRAFFSVDDGKTWFADDLNRLPPFDKDGKQANRAFVFKCADGKEFVGYLQRFTPEAKRTLQQIQTPDPNRKGPLNPATIRDAYTAGREVKRPGETQWVSGAEGPKASKITAVMCPNGAEADPVEP